MIPRLVLLLALCGCFDFTAAGRCFDGGPECGESTAECTGPSRCTGSPVALCDGFEDAALSPLWYVYDGPGATAAIDSSRACRGSASAHVHLDAGDVGASPRILLEETQTEQPTPLADRWLRAFVYVPSSSVTAAFDRMLVASQTAQPYQEIDLGVTGSRLTVEDEFGTTPDTYSTDSLPTDRWVCVVLNIKQGSPGEVHVSIDGAPTSDLQLSVETNPSPPVGSVRWGAAFYQLAAAQGPVDLWFDEIAIDGSPLACAR